MKALLQPEKLFSLTMWLVALLFAWFLMGFGGLIIRDLPLAEKNLSPDQFASPQLLSLKQTKRNIEIDQGVKSDQRDLLQQSLNAAQSQYNTEHVNFENWLATRAVTQQASQDIELIDRTKRLEDLKVSQVENQQKIADLDRQLLQLAQQNDQLYPQYYLPYWSVFLLFHSFTKVIEGKINPLYLNTFIELDAYFPTIVLNPP